MYALKNLVLVAAVFAVTLTATAQDLPGAGDDAGKTVVYRDTWGIPHIYAPTVEGGMYAMGYAQAEDRPEQLLMNLAAAMGESARYAGKGGIQSDTVAKMFRLYETSVEEADTIREDVRDHVQAFVDGMNAWYAAHPEDVPDWWQHEEITLPMVTAFGRLFLYSWSIDDGFGDLKRAGIQPGFDEVRRASNQWAVGPDRSANGAAILYIDPHLSWFGASRFFEFRIHAGDLHGSGFTLAGQPYIGLGHNEHLAWAMTTGAPDTADVYELTLNPDNPGQYQYDGAWRDFEISQTRIDVRDSDPVDVPLYYSHHGPVVALRDGKAYALKTAYFEVVNGNEAWHHLNFAKDYRGAVDAMATQTMFPQNVMVADTEGNIYYQRTGRVPMRPDGYDWSRPVDGSTSATEWTGIHPASDHVQVLNPDTGYMQNCNIPPDAMLPDSPMQPDKYPGYLFSDRGYDRKDEGVRGGWINERGARAIDLLRADDSVTIEEALDYALDVQPYGADRWVELLKQSDKASGNTHDDNADYQAGLDQVLNWNLELDRDSEAALKYYYWRKGINRALRPEEGRALTDEMDQFFTAVFDGPKDFDVDKETKEELAQVFADAMAQIKEDWGRLDTRYGEMFRVGRDHASWPVGGGGDGDATGRTLRSMSYGGPEDDGTRRGRAGQTSTQIVVMTKPIQSWTQPPIGQSDRPESPHYDDQAEKLMSARKMKPTWWLPEDLKDNVKSRVVLEDAPGE
jgi:acyl-homoserine lactone acylase PvdQ